MSSSASSLASNLHPPTDSQSTVSFVVRCDEAIPTIIAQSTSLRHQDSSLTLASTSAATLAEFCSEIRTRSFGSCTVVHGDDVTPKLCKIVGFRPGHVVYLDLIDSHGCRYAVMVATGLSSEPAEEFLTACHSFIRAAEAAFDVHTQRELMHITSMGLRTWERSWLTYADKLEQHNSELDRMASYAAHELKTPLRSMMLDAEHLIKKLDVSSRNSVVAEQHRDTVVVPTSELSVLSSLAQRMYDQSAQLSSQLSDLLFVVRSDQGSPSVGPVDMGELVASMLYRHRIDIETFDASIDVGPMPVVWSNPEFMSIVVSNLIANAIRFRSPSRRLHLSIFSETVGADIHVSFADNGIGVDPEDHDRIFGSFCRLGERTEGLGLGLFLCSKLLHRLNSELVLNSKLDEGACFTIRVPQATGS